MKKYFCPLKIGSLELKNNLIAAPMAGLSSLPYRLLAIEQGCALAISEMVSAEGTIRAHAKTERYFTNDPEARPFGVQLFGANPASISQAIKMLENEPIDLIDINMGCPVKKVCSKGAGAALMCTPKIVEDIVCTARHSTKRPLTVKIRSGWNDDSINCVEIAQIAEAAGADAVAVHGRTKSQEFRGFANWKWIADVKAKLKIPVIGNGDVKCRADAIRMIDETGCDGVMIGRAAVGNPWIFRAILDENFEEPTSHERGATAIRHLDHLCNFMGERLAIHNMRTVLLWYGKGLHGIKRFMQDINRINDVDELKKAIGIFFH